MLSLGLEILFPLLHFPQALQSPTIFKGLNISLKQQNIGSFATSISSSTSAISWSCAKRGRYICRSTPKLYKSSNGIFSSYLRLIFRIILFSSVLRFHLVSTNSPNQPVCTHTIFTLGISFQLWFQSWVSHSLDLTQLFSESLDQPATGIFTQFAILNFLLSSSIWYHNDNQWCLIIPNNL